MSLTELLNGRAFTPDKDDLTFPPEARFASSCAIYANVAAGEVCFALVEFDGKGAVKGVKDYTCVKTKDYADAITGFAGNHKHATALILGSSEIAGVSHIRASGSNFPSPMMLANKLRQQAGVESVIGGKLDPAIDAKKFYLPVSHKAHNSHVVFAWSGARLAVLTDGLDALPLGGFVSGAASVLEVISSAYPEIFQKSDLVIKDAGVIVTISGEESGDWNSALFHLCDSASDADTGIRNFLSERRRKGTSTREIAFVDLGGAPEISEASLAEMRKSVPADGGFFLTPEESIALVLSKAGLAASLDLRPVFREPRPILPKSVALFPKLACAAIAIALFACIGIGVKVWSLKKQKDAATNELSLAAADKKKAGKDKADADEKIRVAESYARWLASSIDAQGITKAAIDTMTGCRVEMLSVKPVEGNRIKIEMDIIPPAADGGQSPVSVSDCINAFQEVLHTEQHLEYFSGSQPVAAGKTRYQAVFTRKETPAS